MKWNAATLEDERPAQKRSSATVCSSSESPTMTLACEATANLHQFRPEILQCFPISSRVACANLYLHQPFWS